MSNTHIRGPIQYFWSTAHNDSLLVAVGAGIGLNSQYYVATSMGSINWTGQVHRNGTDKNYADVAYSPSLRIFVAVDATNAGPITSVDGVTWTLRTGVGGVLWNSILWCADLAIFIAFGLTISPSVTRLMTSTDGINWTLRNFPAGEYYNVADVTWSPSLSLLVAVGRDGANPDVFTSPDGITWTMVNTGITGIEWMAVTWSPSLSLFVAVGRGGVANKIMTSPDGITWTQRTSPNPTTHYWHSVCWSIEKSLYVACGVDNSTGLGKIMTSSNGTSWTLRTLFSTSAMHDVIWIKYLNLFVSVGGGAGVDDCATSPDGTTWTQRTVPTSTGYYGVTYRNEIT